MNQIDNEPTPDELDLSPPEGYESWLVYAVTTFDARPAIMHTIFYDTSSASRDTVEATVLAEFNELRVRAGLSPITRR
ncbi:hypothetical protein EJP69_10390 [Variovorax gossypii]|uniref:Uncharacterized protein n=1 Tax=Variovorax gossypii TaxID=1679495 RepID=A0A3S0HEZ1_9BURK|nr:hypothetical protein [Variovorax gossypii]RTQ34808.1 hypothetical protein EJP69_10390 [Variovorax gossypii]